MTKVTRHFTPRVVRNPDYLREVIKELESLTPPFVIEVKPYKSYANNSQKALYNVWLAEMANDTGNSTETIDKCLRRELLPIKTEQVGDNTISLLTSIRDLEKDQMTAFLSHVVAWARNELNIELRSKNDDNGRVS